MYYIIKYKKGIDILYKHANDDNELKLLIEELKGNKLEYEVRSNGKSFVECLNEPNGMLLSSMADEIYFEMSNDIEFKKRKKL